MSQPNPQQIQTAAPEPVVTAPSYVSGASGAPLLGLTIGDALDRTTVRFGEREALISRHQNLRYTWNELRAAVDEAARGLMALGIGPGERVGIWSPNRAEWVITQFAAAKIGAILVNINPAYRLHELEYALRQSGCAALVTAPRFRATDYLAMLQTLMPELHAANGEGAQYAARAEGVHRTPLQPTAQAANADTVGARPVSPAAGQPNPLPLPSQGRGRKARSYSVGKVNWRSPV